MRAWLRWAAVSIAATAAALGLARAALLDPLERFYSDAALAEAGVRYEPAHTAIVAIDDEALRALKDEPLAFWGPHFGRAIDVLRAAGAAAVGLDMLYLVSPEDWARHLGMDGSDLARSYDAPLRAALAGGRVVLIAQLVGDASGTQLLAPPADQLAVLPGGADDIAVANLFPDGDEQVRHFVAAFGEGADAPLSFPLRLALLARGLDPAAPRWTIEGRAWTRSADPIPIGYAGPPGTVPVVSLRRILAPGALADPAVRALRGRVVIVSTTSESFPDRHFTPYARGWHPRLMAGGEVHANIVETILSNRVPRVPPAAASALYVFGAAAIGAWAFLRLSIARAALAGIALGAALVVPAYLLLARDWIAPVAAPQAALAAAFLLALALRLTREERERVRLRQVFGRYVSEEVVERLLSDPRRPDLAGEGADITVLFCDIRNFTTCSELLTAHEIVEMLNAWFARACAPILAEEGTVDKYIGDAVMAIFGSPVKPADHAQRALRAALGMARAAEGFRGWMEQRFAGRGLPSFAIGVGLHTGHAVIGDIGTPRRKEFTAVGDTVNVASRLEGLTKELGCAVVASDATIAAAGPRVRTGRRAAMTVKGKARPIEVHEVLGFGEASIEGR
jgi:class 3 adenylate cyclase